LQKLLNASMFSQHCSCPSARLFSIAHKTPSWNLHKKTKKSFQISFPWHFFNWLSPFLFCCNKIISYKQVFHHTDTHITLVLHQNWYCEMKPQICFLNNFCPRG
jgi:hypothetical protein